MVNGCLKFLFLIGVEALASSYLFMTGNSGINPSLFDLGVFHFLKTCCGGGMARYHLRRSKERFLRAVRAPHRPPISPIYGVFGRDRREMRPFCMANVLPACPAPTIHKSNETRPFDFN